MNHSPNDRQPPSGQPASELHDRVAEALRNPRGCFRVVPTGKSFMQVSLDKGWTVAGPEGGS
jgi:hypothetical protein